MGPQYEANRGQKFRGPLGNLSRSQCCQKFRAKTDTHRKFDLQSMLSENQGKNRGTSENSTRSQCCLKLRAKTDTHKKFLPQSMLSKIQGKNRGSLQNSTCSQCCQNLEAKTEVHLKLLRSQCCQNFKGKTEVHQKLIVWLQSMLSNSNSSLQITILYKIFVGSVPFSLESILLLQHQFRGLPCSGYGGATQI